jgi:hypothetical protein
VILEYASKSDEINARDLIREYIKDQLRANAKSWYLIIHIEELMFSKAEPANAKAAEALEAEEVEKLELKALRKRQEAFTKRVEELYMGFLHDENQSELSQNQRHELKNKAIEQAQLEFKLSQKEVLEISGNAGGNVLFTKNLDKHSGGNDKQKRKGRGKSNTPKEGDDE